MALFLHVTCIEESDPQVGYVLCVCCRSLMNVLLNVHGFVFQHLRAVLLMDLQKRS